MKVLEIGCGTGMFTQYFAESGAEITAIDLSPDFLCQAASRKLKKRTQFCACDAEALPFADKSFDAVVGISILHHLDVGAVLPEIKRVLKDGSRIVFTEPNMLNPQIFLQKNIPFVKRLMGDSPEERAFTRWQLTNLLTMYEFENIAVTPFDFMHPFLPRVAIKPMDKLGPFLEHVPLVREVAGSLLISGSCRERA